jgi:hypothetical protein
MQLLFTQNDLTRLNYLQEAGNLAAEDVIAWAIYIAAEASLRDSRNHEGPFTAGRVDAWNKPHGTPLDAQDLENRFARERNGQCDHSVEFNFDDSHAVRVNGATLDIRSLSGSATANQDIRAALYFTAKAVEALGKEGAGAKLVAGNYDGVYEMPRTSTHLRTPFDGTLRANFGRMLRGKSGKKQVKAVEIQPKVKKSPSSDTPAL